MNNFCNDDSIVMEHETSGEMLECGTSLAEQEHCIDEKSMPNHILESLGEHKDESVSALREAIASDVLTSGSAMEAFTSPHELSPSVDRGERYIQLPLIYCDQTASNRPVQSIEDYMQKVCLPLYGNTHTNTSITGSQSTAFVAEARQLVAEGTNAKITGKASLDVVLFAGNGATSAVELLVDCMGLKDVSQGDKSKRPVVFVGPYEHHSNLLPWRESGCEIVMVPECPETFTVDVKALEGLLKEPRYSNRLKMGTFSAASNITGKVSDVDQLAAILHMHGALAFFDYATGAPYLPMNMNPPPSKAYPQASSAKDAIFLSPHKMLGGIGTPGVLIIKKNLVNQENAPSRSGGGTVFYVTNTHHRFLSNRVERYEGGTPNIPGILRTGLAFLLKRKIEARYRTLQSKERVEKLHENPSTLEEMEHKTFIRVMKSLKDRAPNLVLLGDCSQNTPYLPIFSFLIRCGKRFLHYNYVCALLNDVFGIQSRGGCQCAGPYSQRLLGLTKPQKGKIDEPNERNKQIEFALVNYKERAELLRPGFTRLSLPFKGLRDEEVEYVIDALEWVAKYGWVLMCQYRCNHRTGEWRHYQRQGKPLGKTERKWLSHYDWTKSPLSITGKRDSGLSVPQILNQAKENAAYILKEAKNDQRSIAQALKMNEADDGLGGDDALLEELRWYVYPKECSSWLNNGERVPPETDSAEVLGAMRPLSLNGEGYSGPKHQQSNNLENSAEVSNPTIIIDAPSRKRKNSEKSIATPTTVYGFASTTKHQVPTNLRDGVYSGASIYSDTKTGFDSGMKDEKNARKKPSRDSSQWGKSTYVPKATEESTQKDTIVDVAPNSTVPACFKRKRGKGLKPPAKMMRMITQAMIQWNMVEEGDRLLLGLSGGKDSLSLLHCLLDFQRKLPINFEIQVCTIDPMTPSFDPSPLIPYVEELGLKYHYIRDDIVDRANRSGRGGSVVSSLCAFCARMKRGNLYGCARKNNCNKLVLAQHLDDCAESFLMSVMHNGFLRTMKAHYKINAGDISVIRPMVYCRESLMTEFAKAAHLPVINENCPACFEEPKERARIKKLLSREETLYPNFYDNIRRSIIPLMHEDATAILRSYTEEAVSKSRKENQKKAIPKPDNDETKSSKDSDEHQGKQGHNNNHKPNHSSLLLSEASEDDLIRELARRRAEKFQLSGSMKRLEVEDNASDLPMDPTGQVCSLNGGNGSIPCR
eukprot:CAMPEP_0194252566 /NCGR_PEP_ID=MMETSP0158-20130606/27901_1 /TAXON_ID=33649 /ORGANISM="Thalassionema nitzschioides, Strain L26-B" /LENGTH=1211 /DNA_ID=CAMNT_0038990015 /DNA_START=106 /DNA_END=3738 /DNA_ORIENTATION=-